VIIVPSLHDKESQPSASYERIAVQIGRQIPTTASAGIILSLRAGTAITTAINRAGRNISDWESQYVKSNP